MSLRLVNWNVEWAKPESPRGAEVLSRVHGHVPELVCLTETYDGLLSHNGHTICSQPDYGYTLKEDRRKVMLWSMEPWDQIDDIGIDSMPPGRFVSNRRQPIAGESRCSLHP